MTNAHSNAPELAGVEVNGTTRSAFLLRGALATGAVMGGSAVGPWVTRALAQDDGAPVDVLNFALTLEYLEAEFYDRAQSRVKLSGDARDFARLAGDHEQAHVKTLVQTVKALGGRPVAKPSFTFPLSDEKAFLALAQTLEDTGVGAYNGAGPLLIGSKDLLSAAGSIVQVEARHAATVRGLRGRQPSSGAFDAGLPKAKVLAAVKPLIKA